MVGSVFTISSASIHCSTIMTSSPMSTVSNYQVILTTATSPLSCASISDVISINSNATFGGVLLFFWDPSHFFKLSAHAFPLTFQPYLYLRKISDSSAYSFSLSLMFATFVGAKVLSVCSWFSYFSTATSPTFLKFLIPFLSEYCVIA